jgi:hypothetical protein
MDAWLQLGELHGEGLISVLPPGGRLLPGPAAAARATSQCVFHRRHVRKSSLWIFLKTLEDGSVEIVGYIWTQQAWGYQGFGWR